MPWASQHLTADGESFKSKSWPEGTDQLMGRNKKYKGIHTQKRKIGKKEKEKIEIGGAGIRIKKSFP